jgi:ubiquitin carboxyl-terminal hydrolase 8
MNHPFLMNGLVASVLSNSPEFGSFASSHSSKLPICPEKNRQHIMAISATQTGFTQFNDDMTAAEIKIKAQATVQKEARGASAMSLIRAARAQSLLAKKYEMNGNLKIALDAFTKAASLAKMTMESAEFAAESASGRTGLLRKEFTDFWVVSAYKATTCEPNLKGISMTVTTLRHG